MPRVHLNNTYMKALIENHLDGGPLSKGATPEVPIGPVGFWTAVQCVHTSMVKLYGISPAAADAWTLSLAKGEIPTVDETNKPRKFDSVEEFFGYVAPLVEKPKTSNKEIGK